MKEYFWDTKFDFGQYKGMTFITVFMFYPQYINWCIINLDSFYISTDTLESIHFNQSKFFPLTKEAIKKIQLKESKNNQGFLNNNFNTSFDDQTDWSNYNDDMDMDQQSSEFWNQF